LSVPDAGDILIGDSHGNRFHVAVYGNDGTLLGEFECPHVKVGITFRKIVGISSANVVGIAEISPSIW
jgi:hypothetical protein